MLKLKLQYFGQMMQRADSLEKTLMLGKNEGRRKGATEDEMAGWHHKLNGHEFERTLGDGEGQGSPMCCSPWNGRVKPDLVTEHIHRSKMVPESTTWPGVAKSQTRLSD